MEFVFLNCICPSNESKLGQLTNIYHKAKKQNKKQFKCCLFSHTLVKSKHTEECYITASILYDKGK